MGWWFVFSVTLLWNIVTPQPVKELDNVSDQSMGRKCCPCPESDESLGSPGPRGDQVAFGTTVEGRSASPCLGGCSSQFRDADSVGASSIFFPSAMRAARPFVSLEDKKEDVKPLLHPEVDLASSVVDTLREVTEEEYRDAVERDAARNAMRASSLDKDGAKNLINVFMNPKETFRDDDKASEISNTNEPKPANLLSDIFELTIPQPDTLKKMFDMDSSAGASNINEHRVATAPTSDGHGLMTKLDLFNIFSEGGALKKANLFKLDDIAKNSRVNEKSNSDTFKSSFQTNTERKPFKFPKIIDLIPKKEVRKSPHERTTDLLKERLSTDTQNSASNLEECYRENNNNNNEQIQLYNNKKIFNFNKRPQQKANEPISDLKENSVFRKNIPQLIQSTSNRDAASDLLRDVLKSFEESRKLLNIPDLLNFEKSVPKEKNVTPIKESDKMGTEIIEIVSGNNGKDLNIDSSVINPVLEGEHDSQINPLNLNKKAMNTKILTHIPESNSVEDDDFKPVDNSEQINEIIENGDKNNLGFFQATEDTIPNTSNDVANLALFSEKSDNSCFEDTNPGEVLGQSMTPQVKSPNNIGNESDKVSLDELQKMSDTLLHKETPFINSSTDQGDDQLNVDSNEKLNRVNIETSPTNIEQVARSQENDCTPHLSRSKNVGTADKNKINDMAFEASEQMRNTFNNLRSPQIVQPLSLFEGVQNPFNSLSTNFADVFNNPSPLIPNIFTPNEDILSRINEGLSAIASGSTFKSALPNLQPLEHFDLPSTDSLKSKIALPKSLDLTPVMLDPVRSNSGMRINGKTSDLFGNSVTLPSLDDLGETFLENAHNLLSTPLETTSRNAIEDTLRSSQVLSENLKVKAKNAVNNFQKNIDCSLKEAGIPRTSNLRDPLTLGANMIEDLKIRHEDMSDKLKGIHYDLTDRLETIRNSVLDHLPNLDNPMIGDSSNIKLLREPYRSSDKGIDFSKARVSSDKGNLLNILSPSSTFSSNVNDKLKAVPSNLKSSKLSNSSPLVLSSDKPPWDSFAKSRSTSLNKMKSPPKSKTVSVPSAMKHKHKPIIPNSKSKVQSNGRDSILRNAPLTLRSKLFRESDHFPTLLKNTQKSVHTTPSKTQSLMKPKMTPSKFKSSTISKPLKEAFDFKLPKDVASSPSIVSKHIKPFARNGILKNVSPSAQLRNVLWPKPVDGTFLTKVREAVKGRISDLAPGQKQNKTLDMARSASENVDIIKPSSELMKENKPYSCKMVCTQM